MKVKFSGAGNSANLQTMIFEKDVVVFQYLLQSSQNSGLARMDDFESEASWDFGGSDSLVLKFDGAKLSSAKREQLSRFRAGNPPVTLQLAAGVKRKANIVGFGARDNTFYLTWA